MSKRNQHPVRRRASRRPPASGRKPLRRLTVREVTTSADELLAFQREFHSLFKRREQREWFLLYLCGQLSNLERKTIEPMILALIGANPNAIRGMQQFIGHGAWITTPFLEQAQGRVADWLGEPDGVVIVDGSGFPKQGAYSVGVGWQYCGHLGKLANCQEGVFLVYASRQGYAFLDERLYVPQAWFTVDYQARWKACGVPDTLTFKTEPELGLEMISDLAQRGGVPFRWVTADETYGKSPGFWEGIAALHKWYLVEVPSDTRVWLRTPPIEPPGPSLFGPARLHPRVTRTAPRPQEVRELAVHLPRAAWQRRIIKEGSKGPIVAEFAFLRATPIRDELPGPRSWAIFRRTLGPKPEVKFYLSNAPTTCPRAELVRVSGLRWPVETALEEAKGEVGMDQYETRTWWGWHHHMTLSILDHLFLVRLQLLFQKKSGVDYCSSTPTHCARDRRPTREFTRHPGDTPLSPAPEPRRLLLTPQAEAFKATQTTLKPAQRQSLVVISEVS
ncbi:MAG: IS701 family transposase [Acidobacteriales bacterium]|nr:IS701 family transposase [Terriglobales bacterium]